MFWYKIINQGISPDLDIRFSKKIRITNQITVALSFLATCYIFIFSYVGFLNEGLWLIPVVGSLYLPVLFNRKKWYYLARLWVFTTVVVVVYIYASIFGKGTGIHLVFIPCACLPWIYFEHKEWEYIGACTVISIACYFFYYFGTNATPKALSPDAEQFICVTIILAVFTYIFLCMRFLSVQNVKAEQYLVDTYQHFFEDIPTPMWIFDVSNLRFIAVNQYAIESYGYSKNEFLGMTITDIHPPELWQENERVIQSKIDNESLYDAGYIRHRKKTGEVFYAHILTNSTTYNGIKARVVQAINVNDKILTENKLEELKISQEKLKAQEVELKLTIKQKNEINKKLERFTYIVAHDIKSPLGNVKAILDSIKGDKRITNQQDLNTTLQEVIEISDHLSEMVDSILDYSKKSEQEQQDDDVDVQDLVMKIAHLLTHKKKIHIQFADPLPHFKTKKLKLMQVFQNLIGNAIKYNDKETIEITVGYDEEDNFYKFYVKDNGQGIKKQNLETIFYLFQTTTNAPTNGDSSTGVGLNILKMLVEEQGGTITVDSTPGIGSCFYFQWRK